MSENLRFSEAWKKGGYRERYAMENGKLYSHKDSRGHIMWEFTYGTDNEYQDANGATYDLTEGRWVG